VIWFGVVRSDSPYARCIEPRPTEIDGAASDNQDRGARHTGDPPESWPAKMNAFHAHPKLPAHNPSLKNTLSHLAATHFNVLYGYRPDGGDS
jgi:hypothetical protein